MLAAAEAEMDRLHHLQTPHLEAILALPCTTLAGARAIAVALAECDRELLREDTARSTDELLTTRLVASLLAMGGRAAT